MLLRTPWWGEPWSSDGGQGLNRRVDGTYGRGAGDEYDDTPFTVGSFGRDVDEVFDYVASKVEGTRKVESDDEVPEVKRVESATSVDNLCCQSQKPPFL